MSNIVQVTNNVTSTSVTVNTTAGPNLTLTQNNTVNTVELNAGLFLPAPVAVLGDIADVTFTGLTTNDLIVYNGSAWVNQDMSTALGYGNIEDLANVSSGAVGFDVLRYSGSAWLPVRLDLQDITDGGDTTTATITAGGYTTGGSISATGNITSFATVDGNAITSTTTVAATTDITAGGDITATGTVTGTAGVISGTWTQPTANGTAGQYLMDSGWENFNQALGDLNNVTDASSIGDILWKTPTGWFSTTPTIGLASDVNTVSEAIGHYLRWNGSAWVNVTPVISNNSDVSTAGATSGQVLQYNGSTWTPITVPALSLVGVDDLTDADTTTTPPSIGEALTWDGANWVPEAVGVSTLVALTDTSIGATTTGDILMWTGAAWSNLDAATMTGTYVDVDDLANVTITTPGVTNVLYYNGAGWVNGTASDAALATSTQGILADSAVQPGDNVSDLTNDAGYLTTYTVDGATDTLITSILAGEILKWDGVRWINNTLAEAGISAANHTHVKADITDFDTEVNVLIAAAADPTLDEVITAGATTTRDVTVGGLWVAGDHATSPYLSSLAVTAGVASVFIQEWNNNAGSLQAHLTTTGTFVSNSFQSNGNSVVNGALTMNDTNLADSLNLTSTDATATYWDAIKIYRNSSSPAANDSLGGIDFNGEDSGSTETVYGRIESKALDVTNGTEDGEVNIQTVIAGTLSEGLRVDNAGVTIKNAYTLPVTDGTIDQVLSTNGSGTVSWATASANPWFHLEMNCYNEVATTEDLYYWYPGSTVYGFDGDTATGMESSSNVTAASWNKYKKMSHRLPSGTYDLDFHIDLSISGLSDGLTHFADAAGNGTDYYVYIVARSGTVGDVSLTQIATGTIIQDATDTAVGTEASFSVNGQTLDGEERILVMLKGTTSYTATAYAHWCYDITVEKTA